MVIFVDPAAMGIARLINLDYTSFQSRRYYYLIAQDDGEDALVVIRSGNTLQELSGQRVEVSIGWDTAMAGFCKEGDEGKRRTKITIRHKVTTVHKVKSLSAILNHR